MMLHWYTGCCIRYSEKGTGSKVNSFGSFIMRTVKHTVRAVGFVYSC